MVWHGLSHCALFGAFGLFWLLQQTTLAVAHPGGLNSEGCHTNRNTGGYHCHRRAQPRAPVMGGRTAPRAGCDVPTGRCRGCGCKGGPGYRSLRTGNCVVFKQLARECGSPPTQRCTFENAPGTGANRDCALY